MSNFHASVRPYDELINLKELPNINWSFGSRDQTL
jgi:hypothetical protein